MSQIKLNPDADIFIFDDGDMIISLNDIVSISGEFCKKLSGYFRKMYKGDCSVDSKEFFSDKDQIIEEVETLFELKILQYSDKENFNNHLSKPVLPFVLIYVENSVWCVRRGLKFFFFFEKDEKKAESRAEKMRLSWLDEMESGLILSVLEKYVECLPAKHAIPEFEYDRIEAGEVLAFDVSHKEYCLEMNCYNELPHSSFWKRLLERSCGDIGIVPSAIDITSQVRNILPLSKNTFLSCHRAHSPNDFIDDEWQVGTDDDAVVAKGKAIMESIERFCGRSISLDCAIKSSAKSLQKNSWIHPSDIAKYSQYQIDNQWLSHLQDFDENKEIEWALFTEYTSRKEKYIPIDFVLYPSINNGTNGMFFSNSNGMAAHTTFDEAVRRGILEIFERDAIMVHWLCRISPNKIFIDRFYLSSFDDANHSIKLLGLELSLLDLTIDTTPVVMSVAHGVYDGIQIFICGASSNESYLDAIEGSLEELMFAVGARFSNFDELKKRIEETDLYSIHSPLDHEALYMRPDMSSSLNFLIQGNKIVNLKEIEKSSNLQDVVKDFNKDIYYLDVTHQDVHDLNLGISVVKVVIPGLIPITFGYGQEPLAMSRIFDVSKKMGFDLDKNFLIDNYLPHFFA